jgi:carboxypeptidase T
VLSIAHHFFDSTKISDRSLIYSRQIYVFPSLNPDGAEYDIATGSYRFWRKNRQPNAQAVGTDNNRNYSYHWGCCGGSSGQGSSETYRGPNPFSTPEDSRVRDFLLAHPNVKTGISYHTYGDLILYPYGYTYDDIPPDMTVVDHNTFVAMGAEMERTAAAASTRLTRSSRARAPATGTRRCSSPRSRTARRRSSASSAPSATRSPVTFG